MAKKSQSKKSDKIETDPGTWDRFEHAVDAAVKSGPKHRQAPKNAPPKRSKPLKEKKG